MAKLITEKIQNLEVELKELKATDPLGIKANNETINKRIDELNKRIDDMKKEVEEKINESDSKIQILKIEKLIHVKVKREK